MEKRLALLWVDSSVYWMVVVWADWREYLLALPLVYQLGWKTDVRLVGMLVENSV